MADKHEHDTSSIETVDSDIVGTAKPKRSENLSSLIQSSSDMKSSPIESKASLVEDLSGSEVPAKQEADVPKPSPQVSPTESPSPSTTPSLNILLPKPTALPPATTPSPKKTSPIDALARSKNFSILQYDVIGFDLDNTLVTYQTEEVMRVTYKALIELIIRRGCPKLLGNFEFSPEFNQRGLLVDVRRCNLLKLSEDGTIEVCYHGYERLNTTQICKLYGLQRKWTETENLVEKLLKSATLDTRVLLLKDCFIQPIAQVVASMVHVHDQAHRLAPDHGGEYGHVFEHVLAALTSYFDVLRMDSDDPLNFFSLLRMQPNRFVHAENAQLISKWLESLRAAGKKLFLCTSSCAPYAFMVGRVTIGPRWTQLFDIVLTAADKPNFFIQRNPFLRVLSESDLTTEAGQGKKPGATKTASRTNRPCRESPTMASTRTDDEESEDEEDLETSGGVANVVKTVESATGYEETWEESEENLARVDEDVGNVVDNDLSSELLGSDLDTQDQASKSKAPTRRKEQTDGATTSNTLGVRVRPMQSDERIEFGRVYQSGNFLDLDKRISEILRNDKLRYLYVGDSLIDDMVAPRHCSDKIDTLAILDQIDECTNPVNPFWGSFFRTSDEHYRYACKQHESRKCRSIEHIGVSGNFVIPTRTLTAATTSVPKRSYVYRLMTEYARIALPDVAALASMKTAEAIGSFVADEPVPCQTVLGFFSQFTPQVLRDPPKGLPKAVSATRAMIAQKSEAALLQMTESLHKSKQKAEPPSNVVKQRSAVSRGRSMISSKKGTQASKTAAVKVETKTQAKLEKKVKHEKKMPSEAVLFRIAPSGTTKKSISVALPPALQSTPISSHQKLLKPSQPESPSTGESLPPLSPQLLPKQSLQVLKSVPIMSASDKETPQASSSQMTETVPSDSYQNNLKMAYQLQAQPINISSEPAEEPKTYSPASTGSPEATTPEKSPITSIEPSPQPSPPLSPQSSPSLSPTLSPPTSPQVMPQTSPQASPQALPQLSPTTSLKAFLQLSPPISLQAAPQTLPQPSLPATKKTSSEPSAPSQQATSGVIVNIGGQAASQSATISLPVTVPTSQPPLPTSTTAAATVDSIPKAALPGSDASPKTETEPIFGYSPAEQTKHLSPPPLSSSPPSPPTAGSPPLEDKPDEITSDKGMVIGVQKAANRDTDDTPTVPMLGRSTHPRRATQTLFNQQDISAPYDVYNRMQKPGYATGAMTFQAAKAVRTRAEYISPGPALPPASPPTPNTNHRQRHHRRKGRSRSPKRGQKRKRRRRLRKRKK